jgi:ferredoxin-NADP reductase
MQVFKSRLLGRKIIALATLEIELEKPEGFNFKAGQYANVSFAGVDTMEKQLYTRTLTISSAPYEKTITFILRASESAYKKRMFAATIGTEFELEGPFGDFTMDLSKGDKVMFIAGGMGISPFTSMIKESLATGDAHAMQLLYLCRRPEEAPFLKMFEALDELNDNFKFTPIMTQSEKSTATAGGKHAHMTGELVERNLPEKSPDDFYIAGPKGMVSAVVEVLNKKHMGGRIFTGEFIG